MKITRRNFINNSLLAGTGIAAFPLLLQGVSSVDRKFVLEVGVCADFAKSDLLKLPDDFEGNMRALLATPPAPPGTAGSRKVVPKPSKAARKRSKPKPPKKAGTYAYESAPVLKSRKRRKG